MAFPTIPTSAAGRVLGTNQTGTSATRTFPNLSSLTKNNGDLLIAIIVAYQSSTTNAQFSSWGGSFTEIHDSGTSSTLAIGVAYKVSNGSETGTFTVTQAATITGDASMILLSIPGASTGTAPEAGSRADGTTAAADPAAFDPAGWAAEDTLWIVVGGSGETSATGTWTAVGGTAPTNYSDYFDTNTPDNSLVGQVEAAVAFRQLNATSENVGTFSATDVSNARNSSLVIAVRPALVIGPTTEAEGITDLAAIRQDKVFSEAEGVRNFAELVVGKITDLPPDLVGITDSAALVPSGGGGTNWTVTPVDAVGITDTAAKDQTINPVDLVGIRDNLDHYETDKVGITEQVDLVLDRFIDNNADPVGLTDSAALVTSKQVLQTDQVGITDGAAIRQDKATADPVGISDTTAIRQDKQFTDPIGLTDSAAVTRDLSISFTDQVGISDQTAKDQTTNPVDNLGITDSSARTFGYGQVPAEQVGIVDNAALQLQSAGAVSPIDNVGITDSVQLVVAYSQTFTDAVGIADSAQTAAQMFRTITDQVGITDQASVGIPPTAQFNLTYVALSPVLNHKKPDVTSVSRKGGSPALAHTKSDPTTVSRKGGSPTNLSRRADVSLAHTASTPRLE